MRKFLLIALCSLSTIFANAQTTIVDHQPNLNGGLLSSIGNEGNMIVVADSFTITNPTAIGELKIYGNDHGSSSATNQGLAGFSLFIYQNVGTAPNGHPDVPGSSYFELQNIALSQISVTTNPNGANIGKIVTIPLTTVNGGNQVILQPGTYWLVAAGNIDGPMNSSLNVNRWQWYGSTSVSPFPAKLYDPLNIAGAGATDWKNISEIGAPINTFAWAMTSESILSTTEFNKNTISIYPNPVKDVLNIQSKEEVKSITLYDLSGKNIKATYNYQEVDMSALPSGVYLLKINTVQGSVTKRVVKN